ncbi:MAG: YbjN domain-containing protein [Oscillospiraceae bacterium]|nr:YbjN domain-containing protein [Oscillospiraceae bacterium]
MAEYIKALAEQVDAYLKSQNWNYDYNEEDHMFRFGMSLENRMNSCRMVILVGEDLFTSYAVCPLSADAESMPRICDYLTRANYGLKIGNFELDQRDGEIRYKSSLFCGGDIPALNVVERVVDMPFRMMEHYGGGLLNVLFGNADPASEIAKIDD